MCGEAAASAKEGGGTAGLQAPPDLCFLRLHKGGRYDRQQPQKTRACCVGFPVRFWGLAKPTEQSGERKPREQCCACRPQGDTNAQHCEHLATVVRWLLACVSAANTCMRTDSTSRVTPQLHCPSVAMALFFRVWIVEPHQRIKQYSNTTQFIYLKEKPFPLSYSHFFFSFFLNQLIINQHNLSVEPCDAR